MEKEKLTDEVMQAECEKMRLDWATNDAKRDQGLTEPREIRKKIDITYSTSKNDNQKWHLLDIYYPQEERSCYPVVINVHGGGWFYGDKELYRFYAMEFAKKGFAVVNFNYRLTPENKYPSAILDVCSVMRFVQNHAKEYQFDLDRVFMVGDSAGAQLTSQYCILATNKLYKNKFISALSDNVAKTELESSELLIPQKIALNCGIYDIKAVAAGESFMFACAMDESQNADQKKLYFDTINYVNELFPETFLMCSYNDPLKIYTPALKKQLEKHKIAYEFHEYGEDCKDDGHVFHLNLYSENGKKCNERTMQFFYEQH